MTPERWREVEELYHAALDRGPAALENAAPEIRKEVEALLAQNGTLPPLQEPTRSIVTPGTLFGPYRIDSLLGAGGMGEVFSAVDTRLGRGVAIKTCPAQFIPRFEREARAISSLNHPHICTLYDVGPNYLVMELVEGETLAARLKNGPLPMELVFEYGRQIAEALMEAHAKGITHRDLKPGNIMIAKMGVSRTGIKVLDFGLAKTGDETLTQTNAIMGTPAYMSPEQLRGRSADERSDIYSFGLVLYEMATGKRLPPGQPKLPASIPEQLARAIERCLKENPDERYQKISELVTGLEPGAAAAPTATPKRGKWIAAGAVLAAALIVSGYFYLQRARKLTGQDTIVLADFTNKTDDPVFDDALRQGLAAELEQSPFLSLVPDERIQATLKLMTQPPDAKLTPEIAKGVCERIGSAAVLEGSITPLGSRYVLGLRAKRCHNGEVLDEEQAQAGTKEEVLNVLSQVASKFRTKVGESLASVREHETPLPEATTPSIEALDAYGKARRIAYSAGFIDAVPEVKRAIMLDGQFARAYSFLGDMYSAVGESVLAAENATQAFKLRDRASDRERFSIDLIYYMDVTGDLTKAQETCKLWAQTYPRDIDPHGWLSATIYQSMGKYEESIQEDGIVLGMDPDFVPGYINLAYDYIFRDRLPEAENTLRRAAERKLEVPDILILEYELAFLKGDQAGADKIVARAQGTSGAEDWIAAEQAFVLARSGNLAQARSALDRAVQLAQGPALIERAAQYKAGGAVLEALFGNAREARQKSAEALALSNGRDTEYGAALALALAMDSARAQQLTDDLEKRFPEDTFVKFNYLPVLRARLALNRGDPAKAIEWLRVNEPTELGVPNSAQYGLFGTLYPIYMRGEAYLQLHQSAEAAANFQKVLDHKGLVFNDPIGALARIKLGQALALPDGDSTKAKAAYQDFLTLWKTADDLPILREAKARYAKLP